VDNSTVYIEGALCKGVGLKTHSVFESFDDLL